MQGSTGKISLYNSISTVDNGVPSEVAHIDLTAQGAAIANNTALFTPAATGMFRVCYYAKVTTVDATSLVLGGTVGFQVLYTDGTDSVAQTGTTLPATAQTGNTVTIGTGNTTNTTQGSSEGCGVFFMKTGVASTYGFGFSRVGGQGQYELHVKVEAM
jgi:hypothetical protein